MENQWKIVNEIKADSKVASRTGSRTKVDNNSSSSRVAKDSNRSSLGSPDRLDSRTKMRVSAKT